MVENEKQTIQTDDGQLLEIRPLESADAYLLVDLFDHLSAESRYRRFNQTLVSPDPILVATNALEMANVRPEQGAAWLAFAQLAQAAPVPVAGVRYMFTAPQTAEFSVTVRDDFQGRGVGTALLAFAMQQAYAAGVRRAYAQVHYENQALLAILRKLALPVQRVREGAYLHLTVDLAPLDEALQPA
ncbi:MAG: GNAT family N-acetyltransferase [Ardenticatenaceae bacterium]|nr:GNAT family N-acetyltransferase [Anaerolineales bacterium]MCB8919052.1 GNAT family N-acetyltransferase [Ardenticatenaceae bacterium]